MKLPARWRLRRNYPPTPWVIPHTYVEGGYIRSCRLCLLCRRTLGVHDYGNPDGTITPGRDIGAHMTAVHTDALDALNAAGHPPERAYK